MLEAHREIDEVLHRQQYQTIAWGHGTTIKLDGFSRVLGLIARGVKTSRVSP